MYLKKGGIDMITKGKFYTTLLILSISSFVIWGVVRIVAAIEFDTQVIGCLRNYVEAGTIEVAEESLEAAIVALEERGLTEGQVSIFSKDPNNNIGLWYNNLSKSKELLTKLSEETAVNQFIVLEKQKNGLKGDGSKIKHPKGISIYPYNGGFFWWSILSFVGIVIFAIICIVISDNDEQNEPLIKVKDHTAKA